MKPEEVVAGFERVAVFEKLRAANRMHHQEVYATLERTIPALFAKPPCMLDIGCGDARDVAPILERGGVAEYTGIDNSQEALTQARARLSQVPCPWRLVHADYSEWFRQGSARVDLLWLGLFLHHLPAERKEEFFRQAAQSLRLGGCVLAHDPVLLEGEDRTSFLQRIARTSEAWPELGAEQREVLFRHWSQHGHQQRVSELDRMAAGAGLCPSETLWRDPEGYYALLAFRRG